MRHATHIYRNGVILTMDSRCSIENLGSAARIFSNRVIFFETSSGEAALLALLASSISAARS